MFLSYASSDRDRALALRGFFETLGFDDIADRSTLRGGFKREAKLNEAIDEVLMPPELADRQQPNFLVLSNNLVGYRNDLQTRGISDTEITRLVPFAPLE